ncbi:translation initiation factor eIF-1A [archaeon]|nr:translation initiation factor eIF-1A [archaeon]
MGKKEEEEQQQKEAEQLRKIYLPRRNEGEMFAVVMQLMGADRVKAYCEDGIERNCRIPGRMKKRVWLRANDIIVIKLWEIDNKQADVVWRYLGMQTENLRRRGLLNKLQV